MGDILRAVQVHTLLVIASLSLINSLAYQGTAVSAGPTVTVATTVSRPGSASGSTLRWERRRDSLF